MTTLSIEIANERFNEVFRAGVRSALGLRKQLTMNCAEAVLQRITADGPQQMEPLKDYCFVVSNDYSLQNVEQAVQALLKVDKIRKDDLGFYVLK